jgi:pimeloyl-ACP methyl ester carboxylesterase
LRLSAILSLALTLATAGCMLPRPIPEPTYVKACPISPVTPSKGSLLFVTFRLPDCRNFPKIVMTWHRASDASFGALADGKTSFHGKALWLSGAQLQLVASASARRPGVVFIHGYNTGQKKALDRAYAIRTAIESDRPVIAITWPSYASGTKYFWDEANSDWASAHARAFLKELIGDTPVIIVAHSMGSRIALDAARSLRRDDGSSPIQQLIMAAPDIDRDALVKEFRGGRRIAGSTTI